MQDKAKEYFEFNPDKLKKISIDNVRPNSWNPKDPDAPEYEKIKESIRINGLTQPVFVRRNKDDETDYEILDGENRWRGAKELGFTEIYIYDEGEVPDELAKSFTIFHQLQNPFDELQLAPIVLELNSLDFELPYEDKEIEKFKDLTQFSFEDYSTDGPGAKDDLEDQFKTLTIRMTAEQFEDVNNAIKTVSEGDNVSEGRSLQLLCVNGLNGYPFDGTGDINLEDEE